MNTCFRKIASRLFALFSVFALAFAPGGAQAQTTYSYSQQELDQMLAPVALYPDALLSQILMAATYPMEVIEAVRWSREHADLSGDQAVQAAETEIWDPSVKSLLAFPQVLERMRENLQWMQALGDAFLGQQSQVLDTVQALRRKAQAAGTLRSDDRLRVVESGPSLVLQPFDPGHYHVPYYDPQIVYGSWWWPANPPVYLRPWPGYYARPAYVGGFYWGPSIGISARFFVGAIDWTRRQVRVVQVNNTYYNRATPMPQAHAGPQVNVNRSSTWRHDPERSKGLAYRNAAAPQRLDAANVPPDRGTRTTDTRRSDGGLGARPDARFEPRRADPRPQVQIGALPPRDNGLARPGNTTQFEIRQKSRSIGDEAHGRGTTWTQVRRESSEHPARAGEVRIRPQWHANPQAARIEPRARLEVPRASPPRIEIRPAPNAARQESAAMGTTRHQPAARRDLPRASAPHAEFRPSQAAAHHERGAKFAARPRTGP